MPRIPTPREQQILRDFRAPRRLWLLVAGLLALIAGIEIPLILLVLDADALVRIQTLNGALVIVGGLSAFCVTTFVLMYPLKLLTVYMLTLYENLVSDMRQSQKDLLAAQTKLSKDIQRIADSIEVQIIRKKSRAQSEMDWYDGDPP